MGVICEGRRGVPVAGSRLPSMALLYSCAVRISSARSWASRCLEGTARVSSMIAELVSLDRLIWIGISKSGIVGVSRGCQFALAAWDIPLVSGWW